jgi:ribosome recycling factor
MRSEKEETDEVDVFFILGEDIENTLTALRQDLSKISIGRAQVDVFDLIKADYYGAMTALPHMSIISVLSSNKVTIEPYDKSSLKIIEKALRNSGLDINPQITGNVINVFFPQMTLERRDKLIKLAKQHGEKAKISLRNHRRNAIDSIEKLKLGQDITNSNIKQIEAIVKEAVSSIEDAVDSRNKKLQEMK